MRPFAWERAGDAGAAARAGAGGATFIAGGTNLLDLMKLEVMAPERLVDIGRLALDDIEATPDGGLRIGALATNADTAADRGVRRDYPVLSRALLAGASPQLRNRATTGGNLCQRTRCPYFYDTASACNKREPDTGCDALEGVNRMHAVLGASSACIATYPGDMAVALCALDAEVEVEDASGDRRRIPVTDFHRLPGDTPWVETVLGPGDLITAVLLPPPPGGRHVFRKVRDRASYAFALVSVAAVVHVEGGVIGRAALAFGGLAHKPWRDRAVEALLEGEAPGDALFARAGDRLMADAVGRGGNDFKIPLARRTLVAALREATGRGDDA